MSFSKAGISIIICCYNSIKLLPKTLSCIAEQQASCAWELIIVDNNSTDQTTQVAQEILGKYSHIPAKVVQEHKAGLSYARQKGVETAKYDYFIFCDDDNWLDKNYAQNAFDIISKNEKMGILGGRNIATFETQEPFWYKMLETTYAVGETNFPDGNVTETRGRVFGAGMVLSRKFWQEIETAGFQTLLSDRKGKNLSTGGDTELCWYARILGYEIHYSSMLELQHFMAASRLTWAYCRKLQRGIGQSLTYLEIYTYVWQNLQQNLPTQPNKHWKDNFWKCLKVLTSSPKRLFRFFFKDIEGEYYFCTYEYAYGRMKEMWKIRKAYKNMADSLYQKLQTIKNNHSL